MQGAADDLAALCRDLGLARVVMVQHSFDRLGYDFAAGYPDLVRALCVLDGPTLAGPQFEEGGQQFLQGLESDHWEAAIRGFADQMLFAPGTPQQVKDQAIEEVLATPRHVLVSTWREFLSYPTETALPDVRCPFLYVGGGAPGEPRPAPRALPAASGCRGAGPWPLHHAVGRRRGERNPRRLHHAAGSAGGLAAGGLGQNRSFATCFGTRLV